jgi:hypothetical protein
VAHTFRARERILQKTQPGGGGCMPWHTLLSVERCGNVMGKEMKDQAEEE